jgi:hypothetical protein
VNEPPRPVDEQALREHIAAHARTLGHEIVADDVSVDYFPADISGAVVFRGRYGAGDNRTAISGVLDSDGTLSTMPSEAAGLILMRWRAAGNAIDVGTVAAACAFVLAASAPHEVLATEDAIAQAPVAPRLRSRIALPRIEDVDGRPGVAFWWDRRGRISEVRIWVEIDGSAAMEEQLPTDLDASA